MEGVEVQPNDQCCVINQLEFWVINALNCFGGCMKANDRVSVLVCKVMDNSIDRVLYLASANCAPVQPLVYLLKGDGLPGLKESYYHDGCTIAL